MIELPAIIPEQLKTPFDAMALVVKEISINNDGDLERWVNVLASIKEMWSAGEEYRKTEKDPYLRASQAVDNKYQPLLKWLKEQEAGVKKAIGEYQMAVEAKAREEQRIAHEAAEAERLRLLSMASIEPDEEEAEELRTQAALTVPAATTTMPKKVAGISTSKKYKASVTNMTALVSYLAALPDDAPMRALLMIDGAMLNKFAAQFGTALSLPGVHVSEEMGIAANTSRIKG